MMGSMAHLLLFAKPTVKATILNRSGQCLTAQIIVDQARGIEPYYIDAYLNPLPVPHVKGPFLFGPNRFFKAYLDERGIEYEPGEIVMDNVEMRNQMDAFVDEWKHLYANPKQRRLPGRFPAADIDYYAQDCAEYYSHYVSELVSGHDAAVRLMSNEPQSKRERESVQRLEATIKRLEASNATLAADLEKSRDEVKHLRNSKSWKITAPLRKIVGVFGGD